MNILWITNIPFPSVCETMGIPKHVGGGWMIALAMELMKTEKVQLCVCTIYSGSDLRRYDLDNIIYYLIPKNPSDIRYDSGLEKFWSKIVDEFRPEVIHIHGTEYPHALACMNACTDQKYVISIQGLVSVYSEYYYAGIKYSDLIKNITINDIRRHETIFHGKKKFKQRGVIEHEYIKRTSNIIGRTFWDYTHTKTINPLVRYYKCNEALRQSFYTSEKWQLANKKDYTLFVSQAGYPIKGLHQVLKALAIIRDYYPKVSLRVAGIDIVTSKARNKRCTLSGYGLYLSRLAKELGIKDCIKFTGPLSEKQMTEEYLNAHVFICPSSIENSPNSIGEAQIIGTPCVASFVGGIPNMISHENTGLLYRFEEYSMLANQIMDIFNNDVFAQKLSSAGIVEAESRHNRVAIKTRMIEIYSEVIEN